MRGKAKFITALFALVAGVVLIVLHSDDRILNTIVTFLGVMLIIPGLINVAVSAFSKKAESKASQGRGKRASYVLGITASVFCIALGVAMLVATEFFAGVIVYVFAAILIALGVFHLLSIVVLSRPYVLSFYFYVIPLLLIGAGCFMLFSPTLRDATRLFILISGIGFVCSAVNSLLEYAGTHPSKSIATARIEETTDDTTDVTDAQN